VYIADGVVGLTIVDFNAVEIVGQMNSEGEAKSVAISGNYAYIADYGNGLVVVNVENPENPASVGYLPDTYIWDIDVQGSYAYVVDTEGLKIVDVEDLEVVEEYETEGNAVGIYLEGNVAYVADEGNGLLIFDVSTPSSPQLLGSLSSDNLSTIRDVAVLEDYAFASCGRNGLVVIDISDPGNPREVKKIPVVGSTHSLMIHGNYLYISAEYSGVHVFDISNPQTPQKITSIDTQGVSYGVWADEDGVYIADGENGLVIANSEFSIISDLIWFPLSNLTK
ncbi:MAG TPA: hypothetical protein ENG15_00805, partial [Thermotoga sp.]|nr:hypothetical protein [Thermotoga sp.]